MVSLPAWQLALDQPGFSIYRIKQSHHKTLTSGSADITGNSQRQMVASQREEERYAGRPEVDRQADCVPIVIFTGKNENSM